MVYHIYISISNIISNKTKKTLKSPNTGINNVGLFTRNLYYLHTFASLYRPRRAHTKSHLLAKYRDLLD